MAGRSGKTYDSMNRELTEDNASRLARALMERHSITYEEAMYRLASLRLQLVCDESIATSTAMQAALVTAVNVGMRAFHGGVFVRIPANVHSLIPWPGQPSLSDICLSFGAHLNQEPRPEGLQTIFFCQPIRPGPDDLFVSATGWRGGVSLAADPITISSPIDFALGGSFAGALAVAKGFLRVSGIDTRHHAESTGASFWSPMGSWTDDGSDGPELLYLPQKLWFLGLGHLGQAYIWTLGLLHYRAPHETMFMLQDFDRVVQSNLGSGAVCSQESIRKWKTRVCANWLEARGFQTQIVERPFDAHTYPNDKDPRIALCGFDSATSRRVLENPGFDLVVESGIGGELTNFDHVLFHTFPDATKTPAQIWAENPEKIIKPAVMNGFNPDRQCGIVAQTLAGKAISSAFIGGIAGAFVVAELLRGLHGGSRIEFLRFQARRDRHPTAVPVAENYQKRFAPSGYCEPATQGTHTTHHTDVVGISEAPPALKTFSSLAPSGGTSADNQVRGVETRSIIEGSCQ